MCIRDSDGDACRRQLSVLEQKMNSDVTMILQIVRQSKLQQVSAAADATTSSSDSPLNHTVDSSQVTVRCVLDPFNMILQQLPVARWRCGIEFNQEHATKKITQHAYGHAVLKLARKAAYRVYIHG